MNNDKLITDNQTNQTKGEVKPDPAKIMYDALVKIAHSEAFFASEKRLVKIAQKAIQEVTGVKI